jgi:hypothetical protein
LTGQASNYTNEVVATDSSVQTSSWFGILVAQSTASFFQKHSFDNIQVREIVKDVLPPVLVDAKVLDEKTIQVVFDEEVDASWVFGSTAFQLVDENGTEILLDKVKHSDTTWRLDTTCFYKIHFRKTALIF